MSLTHDPSSRHAMETAMAVQAYAETSGAIVLAEGIEHRGHLSAAKILGATHGQGWLFGRPGPLPTADDWQAVEIFSASPQAPPALAATPYGHLQEAAAPSGCVDIASLRSLWGALLERSETMGNATVVLASGTQDLGGRVLAALKRYGDSAAFSGLLTTSDLPSQQGLRSGKLHPKEPLAREVCLSVLGPHQAVALIARRRSVEPELFDYRLSHDRPTVATVARSLMSRIDPQPSQVVPAT